MDKVASTNEEYSTKEYWEKRYALEDDNFDWFKSYNEIKDLIAQFIPDRGSKILMLGCGNSTLSEDMWQDGYKNLTNVDKYSATVIAKMQDKYAERPGMTWSVMDVRALEFASGSFDVAIDKGTMDAMMAVKGDVWNPAPQVVEDCTKEIDEAIRVLKPSTGVLLYLTFGQPHFRKRFLTRPGTTLEIKQLGDMFHYYLYVLRMSDTDS